MNYDKKVQMHSCRNYGIHNYSHGHTIPTQEHRNVNMLPPKLLCTTIRASLSLTTKLLDYIPQHQNIISKTEVAFKSFNKQCRPKHTNIKHFKERKFVVSTTILCCRSEGADSLICALFCSDTK